MKNSTIEKTWDHYGRLSFLIIVTIGVSYTTLIGIIL